MNNRAMTNGELSIWINEETRTTDELREAHQAIFGTPGGNNTQRRERINEYLAEKTADDDADFQPEQEPLALPERVVETEEEEMVEQLRISLDEPQIRIFKGEEIRQAFSATGGEPPYTWSTEGSPYGLSISNEGVLSGSTDSLSESDYSFIVVVADSQQTEARLNVQLHILPEQETVKEELPSKVEELSENGSKEPANTIPPSLNDFERLLKNQTQELKETYVTRPEFEEYQSATDLKIDKLDNWASEFYEKELPNMFKQSAAESIKYTDQEVEKVREEVSQVNDKVESVRRRVNSIENGTLEQLKGPAYVLIAFAFIGILIGIILALVDYDLVISTAHWPWVAGGFFIAVGVIVAVAVWLTLLSDNKSTARKEPDDE